MGRSALTSLPVSRRIRFGPFEADLHTRQLRREGLRLRLPEQSFQILAMLLERPGELVTRDAIRQSLWPDGTVVEFEAGINAAVRRLRRVLHDSAEEPCYVETLARLGYRFIAAANEVNDGRSAVVTMPAKASSIASGKEAGSNNREPRPFMLPPFEPGTNKKLILACLAACLAVTAIVATVLWWRSAAPPFAQVIQTVRLTNTGRIHGYSPIVTDGRRVYFEQRFGGHFELAAVSVNGGTPQAVHSPFKDVALFGISHDGTQLLVGDRTSEPDEEPLWLLPAQDGSPRRLGEITMHAAAFAKDGSRLAFASGASLFLANPDGSGVHRLVELPGRALEIAWSPEGKTLRVGLEIPRPGDLALWEVSALSGEAHPLLGEWRGSRTRWADGDSVGDWVLDGKYFIFPSARDGAAELWGMREGSGWFQRRSHPFRIYQSPLHFYRMRATEGGERAYYIGDSQQWELMSFDRSVRKFVPYLDGIAAEHLSYSRDGNWVAYVALAERTLWRSKVDGSRRQQLTFLPAQISNPAWSPDGSKIAFAMNQNGVRKVAIIPSDGGVPKLAVPDAEEDGCPSWSADGTTLFLHRTGKMPGIYSVKLATGELTPLPESSGLKNPSVSPNGRYIAANSLDDRKLVLFDSLTHHWADLATGTVFYNILWSRDGGSIYYQDLFGKSSQPIYRYDVRTRQASVVADNGEFLRSDVVSYTITGLAPGDTCIVKVTRASSDLYAVELKLR